MRSIILLVLALLSISQVIVAEGGGQTKTVEALVVEQTLPQQAVIAEKEPLPVIAEKEPQQQAEPLELTKVTVAEAVIQEQVGGKVTALPVIEETIVAGKLPAQALSAPQPSGIQVIVPSTPERGELIAPQGTPQVVVGGERRGRDEGPYVDVVTPQGQPRTPVTRDHQIGGRGDIIPPNRTPRSWVIRAVNDSWVPAYLLIIPGDQVTWVWGEEYAPMMAQQQQQQQQIYIPEQLQQEPIQQEHLQQEPLKEPLKEPAPLQEATHEYVPIPEIHQKQVLGGATNLNRVTGVERITSVGGGQGGLLGGAEGVGGVLGTNQIGATDAGTFGQFRDHRLHNIVSVKSGVSLEHNRNGFYSGPPTLQGNYTHIFTSSGTYWYMCEVHPNEQRGVIVVSDVPEAASGVLSQPLLPLLFSAFLAVFAFNR